MIGSGAAGITIAREFVGTRHSVVLLEAGGSRFEASSQEAYQSDVLGLKHGGIHHGRVRALGGSTTLWAGQVLPFFQTDFAKRDWVPYSGWPIDRETLEPFYLRAEDVMQVPHSTNDIRSWPAPSRVDLPSGNFVNYYSQFTSTPNFSDKYRSALADAPNIRVVLHASVTSLQANAEATQVEEVHARSLHGHSLTVRARFVIVCCGGIESARLLLVSDSVEREGIGNRHDVVGRFFQDHPGVALPVTPRDSKAFHAAYDTGRTNGVRYSVKIAASESLQREEEILHIGAEIYYPPTLNDPITAAKDLLKLARRPHLYGQIPKALFRVAREPGKVFRAAYRYYIQGQPASVGSTAPHIGFGGEQQPNPSSRVTLSHERDEFGVRRSALDWRMTSLDSRSISVFIQKLATEWKRMSVADVDPDQIQLLGRENGDHGGYVDAFHHMGTTRMGTDQKSSVVDGRCRVHGYRNLYIGSSAVFPTGGFSNPTLTILALCLRIADDVKQQIG